ncbi:MAG: hypothetical protein ACKPKO_45995, partial [Candidatus Fonsibacter sp.]
VGAGQGVGRIDGVARADILPSNTSAGGALYGNCAGMNSVPATGVSLGVGRVGIGGIVEGSVTGIAGSGTSAGLLLDPGIPADKLIASNDTYGGGSSVIVIA